MAKREPPPLDRFVALDRLPVGRRRLAESDWEHEIPLSANDHEALCGIVDLKSLLSGTLATVMTTEVLLSSAVALVAALIGAAAVAIGWKVEERQEGARDRAAKRRELKVQYLIDAYRRLEYVSNRPLTEENTPEFERAIADIQVFGSARQVGLA